MKQSRQEGWDFAPDRVVQSTHKRVWGRWPPAGPGQRPGLPCLALAVALACLPVAARATPPAAIWYGETLACRRDDGVACKLWLDPDGRYTVVYEHPAAPTAFFRRSGRYAAAATVGGVAICLRPDPASASADDGVPALFRDRGCLTVPVRPIGEPVGVVFAGASYTLLLVQGR